MGGQGDLQTPNQEIFFSKLVSQFSSCIRGHISSGRHISFDICSSLKYTLTLTIRPPDSSQSAKEVPSPVPLGHGLAPQIKSIR